MHFKFFNLSEPKRLTNLQKKQLQNYFLQCVCYRCSLLRWMFFVPCDSWKTLFFLKVCRYCEIFTTAILSFSFKQVFWKKSVIYAIGDSALLILMLMLSSKKAIVYCTYAWKTFAADFFYGNVFCTLYFFNCSTLFFIKRIFFFEKLKTSLWKHVFYVSMIIL